MHTTAAWQVNITSKSKLPSHHARHTLCCCRSLQDRIQALEREAFITTGGSSALREAVTAAERTAEVHEQSARAARQDVASLQAELAASQARFGVPSELNNVTWSLLQCCCHRCHRAFATRTVMHQ